MSSQEHQDLPRRDVEWFYQRPGNIPSPFRRLLEDYSKIIPTEVESHIMRLRDEAWNVNPLPCLGRFLFLELHLSTRGELYHEIRERVQNGEQFLDVGCCLGQDIRKLIHDGAPSKNIVGMEMEGRFLQIGYSLFGDTKSEARYLEVNILEESHQLSELRETFDIIHLGMFLHMLDWEEQVQAFRQLFFLSKPVTGSLILGESAGHVEGINIRTTWQKFTVRHNVASFKTLIEEVSQATGTNWTVKADSIKGSGKTSWKDPAMRRFLFVLERVD